MDQITPLLLSRAEFYRWAEAQSDAKYERVFGEVVRMAPERTRHMRLKAALHRACEDAIATRGIEALIDGMAVAVDEHDFIPDVVIHQGELIDPDVMIIPNPVVIFEVLSPSTARIDATVKLGAYFSHPAVQHYVLVRADRRSILHFRRGREAALNPAIGPLTLDPPGLTIDFAAIYDRAGIT